MERQSRKKDQKQASDNCIGSFAPGVSNSSGEHLVNFCAISNLSSATEAFNLKLPP